MISFDFEYYRPDTMEEAVEAFAELSGMKKQPQYMSGGTEVISMARKGVLKFGALIDLKGIKELNEYRADGDELYFGSNMTLNKAVEKESFPLLSRVAETIADHTIRNRITLGGNICGRLGYREAVLPFLLAGARVDIAGMDGVRTLPIEEAFDKRLTLSSGEFMAGLRVKKSAAAMDGFNIRKVKTTEVDYPLLHIASMWDKDGIRLAVSGLCSYPFRSKAMEEHLNSDRDIRGIYEHLPAAAKDDQIGSAEYRKFLFEKSLAKVLNKWGEAR